MSDSKSTAPPRISVVMAVYNGERYLAEAVESILNQTFRDFEFIIINDGSTDSTAHILESFASQDARILLVHQENNGLTKSLNTGLDLARGEFIARMDGDDIAMPERFEAQVNYFNNDQSFVLLGADVDLITEDGIVVGSRHHPKIETDIRRRLLTGDGGALTHPVVMFRRTSALEIGGYDERFTTTQDLDLFIRLAEVGRIANHPDTLLKWRQHPSSVNRTRSDTWNEMKRMAILGAISRIGAEPYVNIVFSGSVHFSFPSSLLEQSRLARVNGFHESSKQLLQQAMRTPGMRHQSYEEWMERKITSIWCRIRNAIRRIRELFKT